MQLRDHYMPYILDGQKLELGDIILESGTNKFSQAIKTTTKSKYSHAMLYVGSHTVMHAMVNPDGVFSKNIQRIIVDSESSLKVMRKKTPLTEDEKKIICNYGRNLTGSEYSLTEAGLVTALNKSETQALTSEQYCSRVIAQSYYKAGISLVKNPDYCSPGDIERSEFLEEIPSCVRQATDDEIQFTKTNYPIDENQKRTSDWLNKCRILFKKRDIDIQTILDVQVALIENSDLDSEVCQYIKKSGYLEHYDFDKKINTYRYNLSLFIDFFENERDFGWIIKQLDMDIAEFSRHSTNYFNSGLNYAFYGHEFQKLHKELYKNLLILTKERVDVKYEFFIHYVTPIPPHLQKICEYLSKYIKNITQ